MKRIFRGDTSPFSPGRPELCDGASPKGKPTDDTFGVWMGAKSAQHGGLPWWHVLWDAAHEYLSQGFGAFPSPPDLDFIIPCNYFTQIASRVPFDTGGDRRDRGLPGRLGAGPRRSGIGDRAVP